MAETVSPGAGLRGLRSFGAAALALGVLIGASACSSPAPSHSIPCPVVQVVPDAGYLTRFAGDSEDLTDTAFEAKIAIANQMCHYEIKKDTNKTSILTDLSLQIVASRGPKNAGNKADIRYFVSVTGPGGIHVGDPKWQNTFDVSIPLTADKPSNGLVDQPSILIPLKKDENGDYYRIYVSFALTQKELAYNRRNPQQ